VAGAAVGTGFALGARSASAAGDRVVRSVDFSALPDGGGWPSGWVSRGVANLRVRSGRGVLEAGSDVFPYDPRPSVFAVDARFLEGRVRAAVTAAGSLVGVMLRRAGPRDYYAAFYDPERDLLSIVRRSGTALVTLAQTPVAAPKGEFTLELAAAGTNPTTLTAALTPAPGVVVRVVAKDDHGALQRAGDGGVLGQARTLFLSKGPPVFPGLGNMHLLPYGVKQGQWFIGTPVGQQLIDEIRRESTVAFREIVITGRAALQVTPASVMAATTMLPVPGGARVHVATDLAAEVSIEVSDTPAFGRPRRLPAGRTGAFEGFAVDAHGLPAGRRAYWRAVLRRAGTTAVGPVRSFPVLPLAGDPAPVRLAIASCGAQFISLFDDLVALDPDVFIWQGDLNYPDTVGPLAQTMTGYAGIWRDFLANPMLAPLFDRSYFVPMRDDHDYGANDSNSTVIPRLPWGVAPWDALMGKRIGCSFSAGLADVWVLDQRRFKSNPRLPDTPHKTLLGPAQLEWLLRTLRASTAPFKVICSPCTVFMRANGTDGNWSDGFTAERDLVLEYIDREVSGRVIFIAGDFHLTGVYDRDGRYEARPCPVGIPVPNDITLDDPMYAQHLRARPGVTYADDRCHFGVVEVRGEGDTAVLEVSLRREDHTTPYRRTFTQSITPAH
jgi:PhoD-like phosphatase